MGTTNNRTVLYLIQKLKAVGRFVLKHDWAAVLALTVVFVALAILLGWANNKVVPLYPVAHFHYNLEPHNPLRFLSNWDGPDYLDIVAHGYHTLFQANFFPLYPAIVWLVSRIIPSLLYSALLVSWASLVCALYFYLRIVKLLFKETAAGSVRAALFFLLFPTGIFLIATYSESLYAALALGSLHFALRKRYLIAALLLALCTATHITGPLAVLLIMLTLYEQREQWYKVLGIGVVGCLGLASYMLFCQLRFHNALAFVTAQRQIHGWLQHSWLQTITSAGPLNVIFVVLLIVAGVYWWNRRRSFAIYSLAFLLIPLVGHQYGGFNRYVLMAFPLQFMAYNVLKKKPDALYALLLLMAVGWAYFALQYAGGYIGS